MSATNFRSNARCLVVFLAILLAFLAGCSGKGPATAMQRPPVPVLVATAVQKDVPNQLSEIGTVEALSTVGIKSRVEGQLVTVHFKEGDYVTRGQSLFTLDPRPFVAALQQAQANLARDQATAKQAATDERRYGYLLHEGVGSQEQYDQAYANAQSLAAAVAADRAAIETAKLNLGFTEIRSPIDGKTGTLQSHPGDMIKADADNPIITIAEIQPIYVDLSIAENQLATVRRNAEEHPLEVDAAIPGDHGPPEHGTLAFIDNSVDRTTGTIMLKGVFPNENRRLWPGQFVKATLTLNRIPDAILVPSQAIETGQQGTFVYVVPSDLKVEARPVTVGAALAEGGQTIIAHGLRAGETVVTDGQLLLAPGALVKIKQAL